MTKSVYSRVAGFILKYWPNLLISTIAAFIFVALNGITMWLMASVVNSILSDFNDAVRQQNIWAAATDLNLNDQIKYLTNGFLLRDTAVATLRVLCTVLLVTYLLKNLFLYIKNILISYVQLRMITELRNRLYQHIHAMSLNFFSQKKSGEITSIILNDVQSMQSAFSASFQKLLVEPINILTFVTLMFIISWELSLIALVILPIATGIIILVGRSIRRKSHRTQKQIATIMNIMSEALGSMRIVKAFVMESYEIRRFWQASERYFKLLFRRVKLTYLSSPISESLGVVIGITLLWIGGRQVLTGDGLTAEDFIRFLVLLFSIIRPIRLLNNVNIQIQTGVASAERIFQLLDTEPEIIDSPDAVDHNNFHDMISFDKVNFEYNNDDKRVLEDISFEIKKGEVVALVGPSGAGKSTLADLIPRFYDVKEGVIKIDGIDIRNLTHTSLRSLLGIVTQETFLFNDTIRRNIGYQSEESDDQAIVDAARAANALEFIENSPEGFDTIIGEKGIKLSGGQKQRLAIARALYKNPPILILDEATSSLDTESELLVQQAIEKLMKDRTVLVIAHRLSTVINADKIIVMQDGKIVQTGTHTELMNMGGLYKRLYEIQFGDM